jgi:hypothetical protein
MAPRKTPKTAEKVDGVCTPPKFVVLRHPALGAGAESVLLRIPAYSESQTVKGYVPYDLLWLAGVIMSGNRTDGYLTTGTAPNANIVEPGSCLQPGDFYFHVGNRDSSEPERWGLLRGMQQWKLEEDMIPQAWKEAAPWYGRAAGHIPSTCMISGASDKVQLAHLVPAALHQWFLAQEILQHASNNRVTRGLETRNSSNMVRLYAPLHSMLDDGSWTFFPFQDADAPGSWRFHSLWLRRNDVMANWHHFRPVRGGCEEVTPHAMLARFANNVFMCMQTDHFGLDKERYLRDDDGVDRMTSYEEIEDWLQKNRMSTDPKRRSKSGSPTKRTRSEAQEEDTVDVMDEEAWRYGTKSGISRSMSDSGISIHSGWDSEENCDDDGLARSEMDGRIKRRGRPSYTSYTGGRRKRARDVGTSGILGSIEQVDKDKRSLKRAKR